MCEAQETLVGGRPLKAKRTFAGRHHLVWVGNEGVHQQLPEKAGNWEMGKWVAWKPGMRGGRRQALAGGPAFRGGAPPGREDPAPSP